MNLQEQNSNSNNAILPALPVTILDKFYGDPASKPVFIHINGNGNRINVKNDSLFMSGIDDFRSGNRKPSGSGDSVNISKSDLKGLGLVWGSFSVLLAVYIYLLVKGII